MRPVGFALLLLAATATLKAHADPIPLTVSGTEFFYLLELSGSSFDTAPPLTLTGTATYDPNDEYPDLTLTTNAYVYGFPADEPIYFPLFPDGSYSSGPGPTLSVAFDYNPNGLSSGTFYFESDNNLGYLDPSGNFTSGHNIMAAYGTLTQTVTPEPSTMTLLGTGLLLVAGRLRKRRLMS